MQSSAYQTEEYATESYDFRPYESAETAKTDARGFAYNESIRSGGNEDPQYQNSMLTPEVIRKSESVGEFYEGAPPHDIELGPTQLHPL